MTQIEFKLTPCLQSKYDKLPYLGTSLNVRDLFHSSNIEGYRLSGIILFSSHVNFITPPPISKIGWTVGFKVANLP